GIKQWRHLTAEYLQLLLNRPNRLSRLIGVLRGRVHGNRELDDLGGQKQRLVLHARLASASSNREGPGAFEATAQQWQGLVCEVDPERPGETASELLRVLHHPASALEQQRVDRGEVGR